MRAIIFTALFSLVLNAYAQLPTNGLVAYYPLNGNAMDASGYGNNGTINGGVASTTDRFGNAGKAMQFNGSNGYILVPNSSSLQSPTNEITLSAWVYIDGFNGIKVVGIIHKTNSSNYGQYGLNYQEWNAPNRIYFYYKYNQGYSGYWTQTNLALSQWHFLTATYNGNIIKIYLNGVLIGSQASTGPMTVDNNPLTLGIDTPGSPEYLKGKLDDVRIYNRALSIIEIQQLYNENAQNSLNEGLVAHYPFDNNFLDYSENGYDGTQPST